jgi:hypothetical protein
MSDGPVYDSPGALPERDDFATKEEFLAVYPDQTELADIYFPDDEGEDQSPGITG